MEKLFIPARVGISALIFFKCKYFSLFVPWFGVQLIIFPGKAMVLIGEMKVQKDRTIVLML